MIMQSIILAFLVLAIMFQVAVDRAPDIVTTRLETAARRIVIVGFLLSGGYLVYMTMAGAEAHPVCLLGLWLFSLSQSLYGLHALFPHEGEDCGLKRRHCRDGAVRLK